MAKKQIRDYVFSPGIAGAGTLKILGKIEQEQLLLITNTTHNKFLYNFSDADLPISVAFVQTAGGADPDFPNEDARTNGVTSITFLFDTTAYLPSDAIQIFVEELEQRVRPYDFGTDAIERMRFAAPESMLDADFEYGIQPTKWQSIDLLRNYPSIYEIPGSDIAVEEIVTDASAGSGSIGPSLITVTTQLEHGLSVGTPISIKGLADSVKGFSSAEGSFIIDSVLDVTNFSFYAKAKVGTTPATSLKSSFTFLKEAGFYTGAEIGTAPTFSVQTQGASGSFSTLGSTPSGSVTFGVNPSSTLPPIGAPISGIHLDVGTQVTGVVSTNTSLAVTTTFTAPVSTVVFNDTNNIEIGAALDNGAGDTIFVTNIEGSTVTLSSPYLVSKTGNSFVSNDVPGSPVNFDSGTGAIFDITRERGLYTAVEFKSNFIYTVKADYTSVGPVGIEATFNVSRDADDVNAGYNVTVANGGSGYIVGTIIQILADKLGGPNQYGQNNPYGQHDLWIEVTGVDATTGDSIDTVVLHSNTGLPWDTLARGSQYSVGERVRIFGNQLGGQSPQNDLDLHVVAVSDFSVANGPTTPDTMTYFAALGEGLAASANYNGIAQSSTTGTGVNASWNVQRTGGGELARQIETVTIGGDIETDDTFRVTIDGTTDYTYTAVAGDTPTIVRNKLIDLINAGEVVTPGSNAANTEMATGLFAYAEGTVGVMRIASLSPGTSFTVAVLTEDAAGNPADFQTMTTESYRSNVDTTTTPAYDVVLVSAGTGYAVNDSLTINGNNLGGTVSHDLILTVTSVDANGAITAFTWAGTAWDGSKVYIDKAASKVAFNAKFKPQIVSGAYAPTITTAGTGYKPGYQINIVGTDLGGLSPENDLTIDVVDINQDGGITQIASSGAPVTGDSIQFYPAVSISQPTTGVIGTSQNITYSAIAQLLVEFASNHGLVPGDTILSSITSSGSGHDLCSGPFYVNQVPTLTSIVYNARAVGNVSGGLAGKVYPRTDSFYRHRPFDGGVQLGTGSPSHGAQAVRQSKKYIRYQSGKGIMYTTGALFAPNYDLRSAVADGTAAGSIITCVTDDLNHGLQVGAEINLRGITTSGYDNHYIVASIINEITFTVIAQETLGATTAEFGEQPVVSVYKWKGATVRAGAFDDQNGIFIQYDGDVISCGLRSSTYQLAGTVTATPNSNELTGVNTKFTEQLKVGDRIVLRGMCHLVTEIDNNTRLFMNPDYRGVTTVSNVKAALTKEILIPQSQWNLDKADGTGKSGYVTDITKMQMMGFQYSWYGAGFIDWMFRGPTGDFVFLHRLKNNNRNNEAFMRSGNLPVRYEVINEGARGKVAEAMTASQDSMTLDDGTLFPDSGTLILNNEIVRYTNKTGNLLSGLTRAASHTNFAGGSQRTYTAGSAIAHTKGTGVVLLSTTATPQINHWGSAFLTDGGFDEDRGYLFSWQEKEVNITTTKSCIFLIRLSPSVSNSVTGDLGERELINRAQLLLKNIEITSQGGSSSQGVVIEGVMNPKNYPIDPANIKWGGLNTGGAGGQPSFAQVASGGDVTWEGAVSAITATNSDNQNYNTNWVRFLRADVQGVQIGWEVSGGNLKGGATLVNIYNSGSSHVYFYLSDRTNPGSAGSTTYTFAPITEAAIPGEQVFSFTADATGARDNLDLSELKELTNTPIGGRGTFPNGPDVLAINAYLTSGSGINTTVNLRWAEAQA